MQNRKWLSVLISVVVSIGLWVYVVTVENPVQELELHNIPVTLSGQDLLREDYDLLITDSNIEGGVSLTFSGKYSDLRKLRENRDQLQLTISVTHLRSAQEYNLPFDMADVTLPSNLSSQDISLSNKDPNVVVVTLEKLGRSTIPVKVAANVTTEEGYTTGSLTQNYDEITVEGPEELVDQISYAQVILERENVAQTVTSTLPFNLINASGEIIECIRMFPWSPRSLTAAAPPARTAISILSPDRSAFRAILRTWRVSTASPCPTSAWYP